MTKRPEVSITLTASDVTSLRLPSAEMIEEANRYAEARINVRALRDELAVLPGFQGAFHAVPELERIERQLMNIETDLAREIEAQLSEEAMVQQ